MANYAINNALGGTQQAVSATYKSLLAVFAGATVRRTKVYDILIGTNGTPADNYMEFDVSRITANGTGTAVTPVALDPADAAAASTANANYTAEPTVTASSSGFYVGINQRASYRWVAAPGSELVAPATANNGFTVRVRSGGYTGTATAEALFQEQ